MARNWKGRPPPSMRRPAAPRSPWYRAVIRASSPWRRPCARPSTLARRPGGTSNSPCYRASPRRWPGGAGGRAARPRFLRHLAVRQPQAVGNRRGTAPRRGGGRLRHRPVQSGQPRPPLAARPRLRRAVHVAAGSDPGGLRPRRWPGRRAHPHHGSGPRRRGCGRHGHLHHRRLGRNPHRRTGRATAARLHAAGRATGARASA